MTKKQIAQIIRYNMKVSRYSISLLAFECDMAINTLRRILDADRPYSIDQLFKVLEHLNIINQVFTNYNE